MKCLKEQIKCLSKGLNSSLRNKKKMNEDFSVSRFENMSKSYLNRRNDELQESATSITSSEKNESSNMKRNEKWMRFIKSIQCLIWLKTKSKSWGIQWESNLTRWNKQGLIWRMRCFQCQSGTNSILKLWIFCKIKRRKPSFLLKKSFDDPIIVDLERQHLITQMRP